MYTRLPADLAPPFTSQDHFREAVSYITDQKGAYAELHPAMIWAVGVAAYAPDGTCLAAWFDHINGPAQNMGAYAVIHDWATAADGRFLDLAGDQLTSKALDGDSSVTVRIGPGHADWSSWFAPFLHEVSKHPNIDHLKRCVDRLGESIPGGATIAPVYVAIRDFTARATTAEEAYLRLTALSARIVQPNTINVDGLFDLLANVAWTAHGLPVPTDIKGCGPLGTQITSIDKFPRMVDFVRPSGVRIADASRVRLGAHLAEGTTVMHEGFVNFNAGTLGPSMVEGRISAGVVIGADSDVGGGASTMGTLSGGNDVRIAVGKRSLLGANSGLGIPIGDDCIVEAGTYLTGSQKVVIHPSAMEAVRGAIADKTGGDDIESHRHSSMVDGETRSWCYASMLSCINGVIFRRHSLGGFVEVLANKNKVELNEELHANG